MVAVPCVQICIRISTVRYVGVEQRLVVVLVLGAMLVFRGRMDMNQRGCKHSDQEHCAEYCQANFSHEQKMLLDPDLGVNDCTCESSRAVN